VAVLLAACGGDDDAVPAATGTALAASPTPAPTRPTAEERSAAEPLLKAAALLAEDLPSGFTLDEEKFTTNADEAEQESSIPGAPTAEDLDRLGRILGYQVHYARPTPETLTGATLDFQIETDLYRDSKGAEEHFEIIRQLQSGPEFAEAFEDENAESQVRDVVVSPISFAKVGDDRMAFELEFKMNWPGLDTEPTFFAQLIGIRRGAGIGFITVLAAGAPHPLEELEDLARSLDERMKDALE